MTKYWTTNSCSINQNSLQGWDAQGIRKGLYSELFLLFFIYFISQLLHSLFYKTSTQSANELRQPISEGMIKLTKETKQQKNNCPGIKKSGTETLPSSFPTTVSL